MFIAALFIIAKVWKQFQYPSIEKWIKKIYCVYIYLLIYLFIYYSVIEKIINGEIYISESARSHLCVESLKTKPKINTCNKTETEL